MSASPLRVLCCKSVLNRKGRKVGIAKFEEAGLSLFSGTMQIEQRSPRFGFSTLLDGYLLFLSASGSLSILAILSAATAASRSNSLSRETPETRGDRTKESGSQDLFGSEDMLDRVLDVWDLRRAAGKQDFVDPVGIYRGRMASLKDRVMDRIKNIAAEPLELGPRHGLT